MTFAASENSARERAARSATPENAPGGRNSSGPGRGMSDEHLGWPDNNASAIECFRIADTFSQTPEIKRR